MRCNLGHSDTSVDFTFLDIDGGCYNGLLGETMHMDS